MIGAFEIRKAFLPEDHEDIGESVRRLAMHFLEASEDPKTALPFAEKAVRICEIHDPDNADGKLGPAVNVKYTSQATQPLLVMSRPSLTDSIL